MKAIRNPHRAFEEQPAAFRAISNPSNDFATDFAMVIRWCAAHGRVERNHRANFGMSPEPYGIDVSSIADAEAKEKALIAHGLSFVEKDEIHWQWLYRNLADLDSQMLLLNLLAYRALGWKYVPMPLDSLAFWQCMQTLGELEASGQDINELSLAKPGRLKKIDLNRFGVDVRLFSDAFGVFNEFIYSQYAYRGRRNILSAKEGDYVLDCGACFGGTSLFFADMVGSTGKVISYEFFPENIAVFNENMRLNPELGKRVVLVPNPVWIKSDTSMLIEGSGPATQVRIIDNESKEDFANARQVQSITIDDTVKLHSLSKVDFIKMDIEGAEMMALRGAKETIKRFRPNLAISVYHQLIDFFEIPRELHELDLGYKFYLQHSTVHGDETVIFATARDSNYNEREAENRVAQAENRARLAEDRAIHAEARVSAAEGRASQSEKDLESINRSTSWRITAPLRWAATTLRGNRH